MRQLLSLFSYRSLTLGIVLLVMLCAGVQAAAEIQPYAASVIAARAQVRSGPGDNFYPTGTLAQGAAVEVYRERADGWLAIRPPQASFSWVFGRHLKLIGDGLAEIEKDGVSSRIGSQFSDRRNAVQVRLKKGEVVEVIGEEKVSGETWYKIAPPAGEFRWIHLTNVERTGPLPAAGEESISEVTTASASNESSASAAESATAGTPVEVPEAENKPGDQWQAPPLAATPDATAAPAVAAKSPFENGSPATAAPTTTATAAASAPANGTAPQPVAGSPTGDLARQLDDIELRLSRMVAAPRDLWNTERLERDTENLLSQAQNPAEREAVKATLAKIDRFGALSRQSEQIASNGTATSQPITPIQGSMTGSSTEAAKFDAIGVLRPVVSKRPGAPQFALVDAQGQVVSFVTPSPDVNLQPYVGHRVGVVGSRGFIPEFNRAHVTAGRVTPLTERLMR